MRGIEVSDIEQKSNGDIDITFCSLENGQDFMVLTVDERDIFKIVAFSVRMLAQLPDNNLLEDMAAIGEYLKNRQGK